MFELTTSNLDQDIREQKIADGLRRRQLLESATVRPVASLTTATPRTADTAPTASLGTRRAAAQR